ncbi:recombinase family protein [Streptosporangium sp. NPDC023963]|uniref:recombinase family protein n=1 Tax=Streptosporangium sp. NPDC023963 TaxID=3155608 RepID=UPI00344611F3
MSNPSPFAGREFLVYLRKSKGRAGIARQRRDCQTHCDRIGGRIVAEFVDTDRTAFVKFGAAPSRRDDYQAMLDTLRNDARPIPLGVIAWHADRLHRDMTECETFVKACVAGNHPVETPRSGSYDLATPTGRKRFRNDVVDATFEVDHMIERIESMKAEAVMEGRWLGGRRPFGYEDDGVTVRPAEAAEIQQMADALLSGSSLNAIARDLNERAVPTSTGKQWSSRSVGRVLSRPRNAGIMEHQGEEVGPAVWPAILDESTWRAVTALLADPGRRTTPGSARRWLLSGIAECGPCEQEGITSRLIVGTAGMSAKGGRSTVPAYQCRAGKGKHVVRNADHLERFVVMHVIERLSRPDVVDLVHGGRVDDTMRARVVEREALRLRDTEAAEMFALGQMTKSALLRVNEKTAERRAELDQADEAQARVTALRPFGNGEPGEVWAGLNLDQKRAVVAELFRVIVLPSTTGRPPGWTPEYGKVWGYFNPEGVKIVDLV